MRFKRARVPSELAAELRQETPDAPLSEVAEAMATMGLLIEQWNLDNIQADLSPCGLAGSRTKVYRIQAIVLTKKGYSEVPPTDEGIKQLVHELVVNRTWG